VKGGQNVSEESTASTFRADFYPSIFKTEAAGWLILPVLHGV